MKNFLKLLVIVIFLSAGGAAFAESVKKAEELRDKQAELSREYEKKQKELTDISLQIHDIEKQLAEMREDARGDGEDGRSSVRARHEGVYN